MIFCTTLQAFELPISPIPMQTKVLLSACLVACFLLVAAVPGVAQAASVAHPRPVSIAALVPESSPSGGKAGYAYTPAAESRIVTMELRTLHGGPFAHHWLQLETSHGEVTIGYGPASIPFIDAGEVSVWHAQGNVERFSGIHILPTNFNYSKPPDAGHSIGKPILLTVAQADAVVEKERHRRFFIPYIPIFHDCRTFACATEASAQGKSTVPCYLLFKGYW